MGGARWCRDQGQVRSVEESGGERRKAAAVFGLWRNPDAQGQASRRRDGQGRAEPPALFEEADIYPAAGVAKFGSARYAVRPWSLQSGNKALEPPVTPCRARRRSHTTTQAATPGYSQLATGTLLP
eukprot:COSAG06_NODE_9816_length_1810_cov_1.082992_3_plen_126_part_00